MKKLRVLVVTNENLVPPEDPSSYSDEDFQIFKMDYDVVTGLKALGHEVRVLGVGDELAPIRQAIREFEPHIAFNVLEEFQGFSALDQNVVSYLELLNVPYTGCCPRGMVLARDKALTKKILTYHRIPVPRFIEVPRKRRAVRPRWLTFPLIVKSQLEEASKGIAQASVVHSDDSLEERVRFMHESIGTAAIVEQYIEGREIYVGVIGNARLEVLPVWELSFKNMPSDAARIATRKVKFDLDYQERYGIGIGPAHGLDENLVKRLAAVSRRIYRTLDQTGYARLDFRLTEQGRAYLLEVNPNPDISRDEEFASAAVSAGYSYESMLQKFINLGMRRHEER